MFNVHNRYYVKNNCLFSPYQQLIIIIMTTKEFIRRSDYFNSLDSACIALSGCNFCWKITRVYGNISSVFYTYDAAIFLQEHSSFFAYVDAVYFETYSKTQFYIDYKFFKAFLSRLSNYQLESLKASGKCSHLLAFERLNNNSFV